MSNIVDITIFRGRVGGGMVTIVLQQRPVLTVLSVLLPLVGEEAVVTGGYHLRWGREKPGVV